MFSFTTRRIIGGLAEVLIFIGRACATRDTTIYRIAAISA
jgi:hypothetical protein